MRILICDDEPGIRRLFRAAFTLEGIDEVAEAGDGDECIAAAEREHPDLIVLDVCMPRRDGLSALPELLERCPDAMVMIVTADGEALDEGRRLGVQCVEKLEFVPTIPDLVASLQVA